MVRHPQSPMSTCAARQTATRIITCVPHNVIVTVITPAPTGSMCAQKHEGYMMASF